MAKEEESLSAEMRLKEGKDEPLIDRRNKSLPNEFYATVAEYMSAKDQLAIRRLSKSIRAALPNVSPLLNLDHFKDSFKDLLEEREELEKGETRVQIKFKLNPLVMEMEPFRLWEFIALHFEDVCIEDIGTIVYEESWFNLLPLFIGDFLETLMDRVLQHPNHPKVSLLTLPLATYFDHVPALNLLLLPANRSKIPEDDFQIALYFACGNDCPGALQVLLDLQSPLADPSNEDEDFTPTSMAAKLGNVRCLQLLLLDERVNPADSNNQAIRIAAGNGMLDTFRLLLQDERVDPSDNDNDSICQAARNGHFAICTLLLQDQRVSPNSWDNSCIRSSSMNGHISVVRLLLADPRVDASANHNEALKLARENGHLEVITLLEENLRSRGLHLP